MDSREFLFTQNTAMPATRNGLPNCTILEYTGGGEGGGGWTYFPYNCTKFALAPVAFTNVLGESLYLDVSYGTPTWDNNGFLVSLNKVAVGQRFYHWEGTTGNIGNYFVWADVIDNLAFTNVNKVYHFVSEGWDYLLALTSTGFATYRLWWETHCAEEMMFVYTQQPPRDATFFSFSDAGYVCMALSYPGYIGMPESSPAPHDKFFPIYCWNPAYDRWNLVIEIPAVGVWKTEVFMDDDRMFLVALHNTDHRQGHRFTTYEIWEGDHDETLIGAQSLIGSYESQRMLQDIHDSLDDFHHYQNIIIATISLLSAVFLLQLILLLKGLSGGGSGTDYQSFS